MTDAWIKFNLSFTIKEDLLLAFFQYPFHFSSSSYVHLTEAPRHLWVWLSKTFTLTKIAPPPFESTANNCLRIRYNYRPPPLSVGG